MEKIAIAKTRYLRISPRKMVGVCKLVRGKDVAVAQAILLRTMKKSARFIGKTLDSAVANAKNKNMDPKSLFISKIAADQGPSMKRYGIGKKGSPKPIKKRTTHLTIVLGERVVSKKASKQVNDKQISKETEKSESKKTAKPVKDKKAGKAKVKIKTEKAK